MKLDEILSQAGAHKRRRRLGRGTGSGHGKTAGRGTKGSGARAGWKRRFGNEGGQNPVLARIPKRGFTNAGFRSEFQTVNVSDLDRFDAGSRVDGNVLEQAGLIRNAGEPIKILGGGELTKALTVVANKFTASAAQKIASAGGTAESLSNDGKERQKA